ETQAEARQVVFYDSSAADFDASTLNLDDESVYYADSANANVDGAESYSASPRSGGGSSNSGGGSNSGGSSNSGGVAVDDPNDCSLTTYGSTEIFESATFTGSGGSDQGPYFGFTTSAIPSGYWAYVRFKGGSAVYGEDYVVRRATVGEGDVVTPNMSYVSGGSNPDGSYDIYVYGPASYSVVPLNDSVLESNETVVAEFYLVDMQSGGADYAPTPILCDSFAATICQAPEFLTDNDANIINTDVRNLGFIYDKPEVGDVVSIPGGLNLETNGRAVTYSLESTASSEYFEINSATGEISWKALPENQTYDFTLTVKATDSACAQQYDTLQLSFTYGWASFVLCVDGSDPNSGGSSSSGSSVFPGHAFWVIEATSSLTNYCRTKYNAANSITVKIDNQDYSYSFANVEDNLGCALGFYPNKEQSNWLQILLGTITGPAVGAIYSDTATLAEVDAYSIKTIPSEQNFVTALAYVERKRVDPDDYQLNVRNCIDVAHTVAQIAGVSFQTSYTEQVYTPNELCGELLDPNKQNNGQQGAYTIGSSLEYDE
ncbi:MAG: cadherin repeat domain-containing protein, partial [Thermoguttaceae bacterium]|nr:cadherin repeat domain-containing protein [Thermoguttaceae bacterium]